MATTDDQTKTTPDTTPPAPDAPAAPTGAPTPTPTAPAPQPAPAAKPQAPVRAASIVGGTNFDIKSILPKLSLTGQAVVNQIVSYMETMGPNKPMTVEAGSRQQVALYRALMMLVNKVEGEEFDLIWGAVLKTFEQSAKTVFHEMYVFRFMEHIQLPETDRKAFLRILNLIKAVAPMKGREIALKQINFTETLALGVTEAGRQRVLNFFGK